MRTLAGIGFAALLAPALLFAQSDELRAQIRADLMKDPRTAELSVTEIDAMVDALASEMESQGTTSEYLESQNTFDVGSLFSPPEPPSVIAQMIFSPLGLAVALLVALLVAIGLLIFYRHSHKISVQPDLS